MPEVSKPVRVPSTLYSTSEIREYFSMEYHTLQPLLHGNPATRTVRSDFGRMYRVEKTHNRWGDSVLKVALAKTPK